MDTLSAFNVRVRSEEDGAAWVLPSFSLKGPVVGVKVVSIQTYLVQGVERKRVITRNIPKSVYKSSLHIYQSDDKLGQRESFNI